MKVGDLIDFAISGGPYVPAIILEVWDFKKYCDTHDDLMLEYDMEDAWNHWQQQGPLLVVLHPARQIPVKYWARKGVISESR